MPPRLGGISDDEAALDEAALDEAALDEAAVNLSRMPFFPILASAHRSQH